MRGLLRRALRSARELEDAVDPPSDEWAPIPISATACPPDVIAWLQQDEAWLQQDEAWLQQDEAWLQQDEEVSAAPRALPPCPAERFSAEELRVIEEQKAAAARTSVATQPLGSRLKDVLTRYGAQLSELELQVIRQQLASS